MSMQITTGTCAEIGIPDNPFPGLRPFEFEESHLFFGRDGQSEQLITKLGRARFLAVVGTSGSGKSSLVRAGFLPALHGGFMPKAGSGWRVAIMRPGNDPIGNLAQALNAPEVFGPQIEANAAVQMAMAEATLRRGSLGLVDVVRQAFMPQNENLLIVIDQFEEIFRFALVSAGEEYGNEAAGFVKLILEASRQRSVAIFVVLTMRSDYLGDCSRFWDLPEAINESQYLIPRLTRDQLREAITGPVAVGGGKITPRLVNRLLNDVGDNQDQLPVLQHLLMRIWNESKEKQLAVPVTSDGQINTRPHKEVHEGDALDLCCAEAVGGMTEALSRHADEAFNELPDERHRAVARKLFEALTEKGADNREIRRPITLEEICAIASATPAEAVTVIDTFRRADRSFLMPPADVGLSSESLIDISHESLIRRWARLKAWVEEEVRSARIYRRLAETAVLHQEGGAGLWRDPDLQIALRWRKQNNPNQVWARRYHPEFASAMEFLGQSRRRKRSRRMLYGGLVVAVVISLLGVAWYWQGRLIVSKLEKAQLELLERKQQVTVAKLEHVRSISKLQQSALAGLLPEAAEAALKLIDKAKEKGMELHIVDGYRSLKQQQERVAEGRARTKVSTHITGLAFDVAIDRDGALVYEGADYDALGPIGEELGLVWGGRRTGDIDKAHFETRGAEDALKRLKAGS